MSDLETLLTEDEEAVEDDELADDTLESDEEPSDDEETDPVEALRKEVEALKTAPPWMNEFKTEVGRIRSIEARLAKAEDPTERTALRRDLETKIDASTTLIAKLLSAVDDDLIDPKVKTEAQAMLTDMADKTREAALIEKLRAEMQPEPVRQDTNPTWYTPEVKAWDDLWLENIKDEGLDIEDFQTEFQQAATLFSSGGSTKEATAIFRGRLKTLREEQATAKQRQTIKKKAGAGSPKGGGGSFSTPLENPNATHQEREAYLRSLGGQL